MTRLRSISNSADDPCLQIQADLSAMLDGELDASSVRRVLIHSDACPSCSSFLDGIRMQARAHADIHRIENAPSGSVVELSAVDGGTVHADVDTLRRQLTENRRQLAQIFYELGRGFVFLGVSPRFARVVQREPVPMPDMFQRGRILIDEVSRLVLPGSDSGIVRGREWVRAQELFDSGVARSPGENLQKGIELLRESLLLDGRHFAARIHLGHALQLADRNDLAKLEYEAVLSAEPDLEIRSYALLNLGNVHLDEGDFADAIECFLELVDSGIVEKRANFGLTHFNLAIAYGLSEDFDSCGAWLTRLYDGMPHKRRLIAEQLRAHPYFAETLARHPEILRMFVDRFPGWFPISKAV